MNHGPHDLVFLSPRASTVQNAIIINDKKASIAISDIIRLTKLSDSVFSPEIEGMRHSASRKSKVEQ